ncbi:hypothetical protein [Halalkalibacter hemicellulosilyticus]|uniref:Uncharacterized protein n=1 Tax=Halalkalibacter hemicellulosilyticusJCM 9152 TaxID=1236971 RepID=W4QHD6_9BACI|nr:hypothetical protein [Halalkalibacter hemicellulosilyticus]GAE31063.1 hypothetical protein JCM9152_2502 [Halalkalibacter hemicellulosilyticusJCM 9152]
MHPTHYENLKVAFENQLYDLDNIDQVIDIVDRSDRVDLATMDRMCRIQFRLHDVPSIKAEVCLRASLLDSATELLELEGETGCSFIVRLYMELSDVDTQCVQIEQILQDIWQSRLPIEQRIQFTFQREERTYLNQITVRFDRKLNERHMSDIPELLSYLMKSLRALSRI